MTTFVFAAVLFVAVVYAGAQEEPVCNVRMLTEFGWVCSRVDGLTDLYISFKGVPYAKQPLGKLRFKELQSPEPWKSDLVTIEDGPICPQKDYFYRDLMSHQEMSEACISANVHVPTSNVIWSNNSYVIKSKRKEDKHPGMSIIVYIHGGGFAFGSGATDIHGPQDIVDDNTILITFNYRVGPFGFLSLNSPSIPGNAGLRDMITLLRWVQRNARYFGGNPKDVTLVGQSAGAAAVHLLSLSPAAEGLFKRLWMMSGTATRGFFSPSPVYGQFVAKQFVESLGITTNDPEEIHEALTEIPLEQIMNVTVSLQNLYGITAFVPVVETSFSGVTTVIDRDPEESIRQGRGEQYPMVVGFTDKECEAFRPRFNDISIVNRVENQVLFMTPPVLLYTAKNATDVAYSIKNRYTNKSSLDMQKYITYCTEAFFAYPALKLAQWRGKRTGSAPLYLYRFSYNSKSSVLKKALGLSFEGAGHFEDSTYLMRVNSVEFDYLADDDMRNEMKQWFRCYVKNSNPICYNGQDVWPRSVLSPFGYKEIHRQNETNFRSISQEYIDALKFYDRFYGADLATRQTP